MSALEKLIIYFKDGSVKVEKWPSQNMKFHIEDAKKLEGFLECRTELA